MKKLFYFAVVAGLSFSCLASMAHADPPYGTIVHEDGSMVAIYSKNSNSVVIAKFTKNGQMDGGCKKESRAAWQARRAYMKAKSNFRKGYVPRKWPCSF